MIWNSIPLMTVIDLVIFSLASASLYLLLKRKKRLMESNFLRATAILVTGLSLIGIFYLADLLIMWVLPLFTTTHTSMAVMESLHLNLSWINTVVVILCIFLGFLLMTQKLLGQSSKLELMNAELRTEVKDRKQAKESLEERLTFEALLAKISSDFINLPASEIDKEIKSALGLLGELMKVDRAYISEFSEDQTLVSLKHEWTASKVQPRSPAFQNLEIDLFPWIKEKRFRGDIIVIPSVDMLPDEADPERKILEKSGTKSMVSVPLSVGGKVQGSVGFDATASERTWPDAQIKQLRLVGEIFANALTRKQNEEALKASEQRLKLATAVTQLGTYDWYPLENAIHWDDRMHELFGLSRRSSRDRNEYFYSILHPEDRERVTDTVQSFMDSKTKETNFKDEYRIVLKNQVKHIATQGVGFRNKKGVVTRIIGTCLDITKRKKVEETLIKSEQKFSKAFRISPAAMTITTIKGGRIIDVNDTFLTQTGYTRREVIGNTAIDLGFYAKAEVRDHLLSRLQKTGSLRNYELKYQTKAGKLRIGLLAAEIIEVEGEPCSLGVISDITERKKAEEALLESEERFKKLSESAFEGIVIADKGQVVDANTQMAEILGLELDELIGKNVFEFIAPESRKLVERNIKSGFEGPYEHLARRPDGSVFPVVVRAKMLSFRGKTTRVSAIRDITERKEAETALQREKVFSERLINSSVDGILAFDPQCRYTVWNQGMERISGVSHTEILGKYAFEVFPFLKDIGEDKFFYDALAGETVVAKDRPYIVPETGQEGFFEGHYSPLRDATGNIIGALAVIRETTERKQAEEALRQSEGKYRQIVETAQEGIWTIDAEARTTFVNAKMAEMLGYKIEEMLGAEIFKFMDKKSKKISERNLERRKQGIQEILEFKFKCKNGDDLWGLLATNPLVDKDGNYIGSLAMITDITDRKEAEEKMNRYQDKLRALAAELSSAEDQERRRIASDLHDRIGQSLAISKMRLAELRQTVQSTEIASEFEEFQKALDQVVKETRTLTYEISPPLLYELGFEEALEWLTEDFSNKHALKIKFENDGKSKNLDDPIRIFLFRAVRELLVNVIKHAKANSVNVTIQKNQNSVQLQVRDDGTGFDVAKPRSRMEQSGGFGLFNIRDRLDYYGGKFEIRSKKGQGTHVTLSAPLKK